MNDLRLRILELASGDEELAKRLSQIESYEELAAALKENGIETTAEELERLASDEWGKELSEDELRAVAGGDGDVAGGCFCVVGGGGKEGSHVVGPNTVRDKTCWCVGVGQSSSDNTGAARCKCILLGDGQKHLDR